ncbi:MULTISPECIES: TRAP transporter substrate-binding protein DctP [Halomonas]|uniref:TRAP transporter substrate-binding protein DctP n=3 Tax=Halomonas TaxID=2745 RepID=A0AAU7KGU0_9GAMM|nr:MULTISPECIES: TRAP transporter substrate-binding protein DctP [Halomonas]MBR9770396.1 twin-arginine translocation signal domain-containing protein [Gammaproteobacteria bacterium]MAR72070.1 ABC transporter substrate-binding protein [Halomonas sp.]MBR9879603.1 twin-arginine translocation signal domain-containing protein [Gammaproteobacteria bacterium]MBY5943554.1 TRAP transporter substrate-binding protein DctP [Halomonas sp. DP5N14-9]MBY6110041.1 TRAP transporter substrate-binding protein Dct|tara:strand:+ start:2952 stop:4121 length:1170 start_codon:yes stop_codon:yes gene_type:complete
MSRLDKPQQDLDTASPTASLSERIATPDRRRFLKAAAVGSAAAVAAPWVGNVQAQQGIRIRMQSSWQPGTTGYRIFEEWAAGVAEATSGEVTIEPFPAGAVAGAFEVADAVRNGVLDGQNWFTVYWPGKMPAGVFLTAYPMGLSVPHQWDMMFGAYGGFGIAKDLYRKQGQELLGYVHHDLNLIHSKVPLRSFDDFEGVKIRMPGGIVAETFAKIGARTTLLPGSEVYPALEKGTIDAADYTGAAVNFELGFWQVTDYIIMGPPSTPCLHQAVDLMDIAVNRRVYERMSDQTKDLMHDLVAAYSREHYAAIQKANAEAWPKYREKGVEIIHLSEDDADRFRDAAIPLWFEWANKDPDAAKLFRAHLNTMLDPSVALITEEDIKDFELNA